MYNYTVNCTSACSSPDALLKCWKAVSPSPPTPHTMYCSMLRGSMGISHILSSAHKHNMWRHTLQTKQTYNYCTCSHPNSVLIINRLSLSVGNTLTGREVSCIDDTLLISLSGSTHRHNVIGAAATEMVLVRACTDTISTLQRRERGKITICDIIICFRFQMSKERCVPAGLYAQKLRDSCYRITGQNNIKWSSTCYPTWE